MPTLSEPIVLLNTEPFVTISGFGIVIFNVYTYLKTIVLVACINDICPICCKILSIRFVEPMYGRCVI